MSTSSARLVAALRWAATRVTRNLVLFIFGLGGITYETVADHSDRPTLLILFGAMVGLPPILRADETRLDKKKKDAETDRTEADR